MLGSISRKIRQFSNFVLKNSNLLQCVCWPTGGFGVGTQLFLILSLNSRSYLNNSRQLVMIKQAGHTLQEMSYLLFNLPLFSQLRLTVSQLLANSSGDRACKQGGPTDRILAGHYERNFSFLFLSSLQPFLFQHHKQIRDGQIIQLFDANLCSCRNKNVVHGSFHTSSSK